MDFLERLADYIDELDLPFKVVFGLLKATDSISLNPAVGAQTLKVYFDDAKDRRLPYELEIKVSGADAVAHQTAMETLKRIATELETVERIESKDESFEFLEIKIPDEPFFIGQSEEGSFFYRLSVQADLTIKGDDDNA